MRTDVEPNFGMICVFPLVVTLLHVANTTVNGTTDFEESSQSHNWPLVLGGLSSVLGLSVYGFYTFSKKKKKQCSTSTKKWYTSNKSQVLSLSLQKIGDLPRSKTSKTFSLQSVVSTKSRKNNKRQRSKSSKTSLKSKSTKKEASLKSKTSTLNIQK